MNSDLNNPTEIKKKKKLGKTVFFLFFEKEK